MLNDYAKLLKLSTWVKIKYSFIYNFYIQINMKFYKLMNVKINPIFIIKFLLNWLSQFKSNF